MRNFNTSFVKNAICLFVNEASQVLRAFSDPATALLRLIQSTVRATLELALPISYRHLQLQPSKAVAYQGTSERIDRVLSVMPGTDLVGELGNRRWDCRLSHVVS